MRWLAAAWLALAPTAAGRERAERAGSIDLDLAFRGPLGALDLDLRKPRKGWIELRRADERFEDKAFVVRFGDSSPRRPSKVEVQVGGWLQRLLFVAALLFTFVL